MNIDGQYLEGLFSRIDRLVRVMEGEHCKEPSGETWMRAATLLKLPDFAHRKGQVWLYRLAKDHPEIMKKECLPGQKRGATLWCVERISKALKKTPLQPLSN